MAGIAGPAPSGLAETAAVTRSALWLDVRAQAREREDAASRPDRRLTPEQLQQLRDQVRRAGARPEPLSTASSEPPLR